MSNLRQQLAGVDALLDEQRAMRLLVHIDGDSTSTSTTTTTTTTNAFNRLCSWLLTKLKNNDNNNDDVANALRATLLATGIDRAKVDGVVNYINWQRIRANLLSIDDNDSLSSRKHAHDESATTTTKKIKVIQHDPAIDKRDEHGRTSLVRAAGFGNLGGVERLLSHGANVNAANNNDGITALHRAVGKDHVEVAALLLDNDADIGARATNGNTPLIMAAGFGRLSCAALLLDRGAKIDSVDDNGFTALNVAVLEDYLAIVELLVKRGADLERANECGDTPLLMAAAENRVEIARCLLDNGANVDAKCKDGLTPLHWTSKCDHVDVFKMLLDRGANVRALANDGTTALHLAAIKNHAGVAALLMSRGALVDAVDNDGMTPLHYAACRGCALAAKVLLKSGAHVDSKNNHRNTSLHFVANTGDEDGFFLLTLYAWGANENERTLFGQTPFHCATSENSLLLLSALGVDENAIDDDDDRALNVAIKFGGDAVVRVRTLLQLNVDTNDVVTDVNTPAEIVQLLDEHRQRTLSKRISIRNQVLEAPRARIEKFMRFEAFEWREIHEMIVDFTISIGHFTKSSYELMWIFNFVRLTPRLTIGDVHHDIQKLRVIDEVKASVERVYERRADRRQLRPRNATPKK